MAQDLYSYHERENSWSENEYNAVEYKYEYLKFALEYYWSKSTK